MIMYGNMCTVLRTGPGVYTSSKLLVITIIITVTTASTTVTMIVW
jgi:hypothetical protein